jgi:hypothetical protein
MLSSVTEKKTTECVNDQLEHFADMSVLWQNYTQYLQSENIFHAFW